MAKANTINPKERHEYNKFFRLKTTPEEDKVMKQKAAQIAASKKYLVVGCSCLDVQKAAYSALAESRTGSVHSLIAQDALKILEPNAWFANLPSTINTLNWYITIVGGNPIKKSFKPVIDVYPVIDVTPKNKDNE